MVYRGKLSKACSDCRRRKLRCDLKPEQCGQCTRASLTCSGYRDTNQLRINDESFITQQKVLARRTLHQPLTATINERAHAAFFEHYVSGFAQTYDVLDNIYGTSSQNKHLKASIDAASLAFFAVQTRSIEAAIAGRRKYLVALPLLYDAINSPEAASDDTTLMAALLLDLFEKTTTTTPQSTESWLGHVNGALALVRMRNPGHLSNNTSLKLSVRLALNLLISCMVANTAVPPSLVELRATLDPYMDHYPKWKISSLSVDYAQLNFAVSGGRLKSTDIVVLASALDAKLQHLEETMPQSWSYTTTKTSRCSKEIFGTYYHTYPDRHVTQGWNVIRKLRISLNDMVITHVWSTGYTTSEMLNTLERARDNIDAVAKDICASIPQYAMNKTPALSDKMRCYTVLHPLYMAGRYSRQSTGIKPWAVEQLRSVAHKFDIEKANTVADILERGDDIYPWEVYTILGSYAFAA